MVVMLEYCFEIIKKMKKIIKTIYNKCKVFNKKHAKGIGTIVLIINMLLIAIIFEETPMRGLLFAISILLILALVRVAMGWQLIMDLMRNAETIIFGKSLDKENWNESELKNTKVKILWRKKKIKKKN